MSHYLKLIFEYRNQNTTINNLSEDFIKGALTILNGKVSYGIKYETDVDTSQYNHDGKRNDLLFSANSWQYTDEAQLIKSYKKHQQQWQQ